MYFLAYGTRAVVGEGEWLVLVTQFTFLRGLDSVATRVSAKSLCT